MRLTGLNFDQVPSLDTPFRFYLIAPIFAVIAGLVLAYSGEEIWLSRWSPTALAVTHLFALGVMAMIMFGSLFQLLPVLCGTPIRINRYVLWLFLLLFFCGVISLAAGFFQLINFLPALVLLAGSLLLFIIPLVNTLIRFAGGRFTRIPILLAVCCLAITVLLGMGFLTNYLWGTFGALSKSFTNIHAGFGVYGWVSLLIVTVSFQVIPMFHVTPEFPEKVRVYLPLLLFVLLVGLSGELLLLASSFSVILIALLLTIYSLFALKQLSQRKRKLPDNTIKFWQLALTNLVVSSLLFIVTNSIALPEILSSQIETIAAILLAIGCVLSVIQGMLLKIVPFLITLHLQQHAMKYPMGMGLMPDHYSLISRKQGTRLWYFHITVLTLLLLSGFIQPLVHLAGLVFSIAWGYLWWLIFNASKSYRHIKQAIENS